MNWASWYYRNLLKGKNDIIENIYLREVQLLDGEKNWEAAVRLNSNLRPSWIAKSKIYGGPDGSGTSSFKNIAIHKAISECLERWAFYHCIDHYPKKFGFDIDPSTTGMAAFPAISYSSARLSSMLEAYERWSLCAFMRSSIPIVKHSTSIQGLDHFELKTGEKNIIVSVLRLKINDQYFFGFAASTNLAHSFTRAMYELCRNVLVLKDIKINFENLDLICDKRLYFYSTSEGNEFFDSKVKNSPKQIKENPKLICDEKIDGVWTQYAKVWRCLLLNSYPENEQDHTFFLF